MHVEGAARWALERLEEMFDARRGRRRAARPGHRHLARGRRPRACAPGAPTSPFELPPRWHAVAPETEPVVLERPRAGLQLPVALGPVLPHAGPRRARGRARGGGQRPPSRRRRPRRRRISDLARAAGLAIDNARWLERIHTLGMEQERTRLARELHDHIGQSVVYLGFEIDRLVELNHGRPVQADLMALRGDLRDLVEEMRDMLVDLRSDVSETQGVEGVLQSFLDRVNKRNRVEVSLVADADSRMPLPVEREVWRVAREAVMNAERHAQASHVSILWLCNRDGALLEVADDGVGLPAGKAAGASGYGLVGMRERADSIGAQLEITSGPGKGTLVRMRMKAA